MNISPAIHRRRRHAPEFKQALVALCQPGVSVSAVALAHGLNSNLLRRWIKQFSVALPSPSPRFSMALFYQTGVVPGFFSSLFKALMSAHVPGWQDIEHHRHARVLLRHSTETPATLASSHEGRMR